MHIKLNISIIILFLALVAVYINSVALPNQQIVIETGREEQLPQETSAALEKLKSILISNGAQRITITELDTGELKITYFSASGIYDMQKALALEDGLNFAITGAVSGTKGPIKETGSDYILKISELQAENSSHWDFESTEIVNLNIKADRFTTVNHNDDIAFFTSNQCFWAYQKARKWSLEKGDKQRRSRGSLPEVRAGPMA